MDLGEGNYQHILEKGKYISVTDEPEHLIPSQESPHGSPPLDFQPVSCEGDFKLLYITLRAETAKYSWHTSVSSISKV